MRTVPHPPAPTGTIRSAIPLRLDHGTVIDVNVGFELAGEDSAPVIIVLGGISARRHVAAHAHDRRPGWWDAIVGAGLPVDTRQSRVLSIDWLGGAGTSSGPPVFRFAGGRRIPVTTHDQARAVTAALDHLGIDRAAVVIGASYGGMVALALAAMDTVRVERVIAIAAAERSHPMATALRTLQRRIVRLGLETGAATEAVSIARGIALTTYRTADEFATRFGAGPVAGTFPARFEVEDYLEHCGSQFAQVFPPDAFLCLSESLDLHAVDPASVTVPTTLIAFDSDTLVPAAQLRALHRQLPVPDGLVEITSMYGHDAFLKETTAMTATLTRILTRGGVV
ncbi:MAG TPA: homoserine O-succinyltransferase [Longimicrobiales bacterium]|nr:homoserine O-succinyltransferase [Longimicrobiales bacterium]